MLCIHCYFLTLLESELFWPHSAFQNSLLPMKFWFFPGLLIILLGAFSVCDLKKSLFPPGAVFLFLQMISLQPYFVALA